MLKKILQSPMLGAIEQNETIFRFYHWLEVSEGKRENEEEENLSIQLFSIYDKKIS